MTKLPDKLIGIPNPDKTFHEKWKPRRNKLNIPHPFRATVCGMPGAGKTNTIKNIIIRADPPFKQIFVIHCDGEYTKEYDDMDVNMLSEIPPPDAWEGKIKTLVVLDDCEYKSLNKEQLRNLDRLVGYCSTHKNISVINAVQELFTLPTIVRRCSNLWVIWKPNDMDSLNTIGRKLGISSKEFKALFNLCPEFRDSIWIDQTPDTPYPLRKNGFEIINKQ
jgi:hypothetical protein